MNGQELRSRFQEQTPAMLDLLAELVAFESPSRDKSALDRLGDRLTHLLKERGCAVERIANDRGGGHLWARLDVPGAADQAPALVIGHFDTVWPLCTLATMPFRVEDGRAHGPGAYDMKAGLVMFLTVLRVLEELGPDAPALPRPVWALLTSDEEIGSPTSRGPIEDLARRCAYALVLEPPTAQGALKTARKGVGRFRMTIEGRAAHAGIAPEDGRSAIVELAHQILKIQELQDQGVGTTLNVGVVEGGTTPNVVPARASAEIDARAATAAEAERVSSALAALRPVTPEVVVKVEGAFNRPPMERSAASGDLFDQARAIGRSIGLDLAEGATGGGSDGNFTAALGTPTLDGLGATGAGAHAVNEHIVIESLPERAALLAALLLQLKVGP